ncbi:STAS domain-containing protein [Kitasatospora sp. NPDC059571]|uniref:STAS domain-containing protein n=1 Tax=Kitasatospora sp. NPDC059571 TaxID=3346871 RepID=UPI0036CEA912
MPPPYGGWTAERGRPRGGLIDRAEHDFAFHVRPSPSGPVVACSGELDLHEVHVLARALDDALAAAPLTLVVHLGALDFIDSSGLNALLHARIRAERQGTALHLADPSPPMTRLLHLTCTDRVLTIDPIPGTRSAR